MRQHVAAFAAGILFAVGLVVSGMTQPAKVVAFLDFTGAWDPSLAFVMIGAIGVCLPLLREVTKLRRPMFSGTFLMPPRRSIDRDLLTGSALFGIGWGVSGFCPGPAIVTLGTGAIPGLVFVVAMGVGMYLQRRGR